MIERFGSFLVVCGALVGLVVGSQAILAHGPGQHPQISGNPDIAILAAAAIASQQNHALSTASTRASRGVSTESMSNEDDDGAGETSTFADDSADDAVSAGDE